VEQSQVIGGTSTRKLIRNYLQLSNCYISLWSHFLNFFSLHYIIILWARQKISRWFGSCARRCPKDIVNFPKINYITELLRYLIIYLKCIYNSSDFSFAQFYDMSFSLTFITSISKVLFRNDVRFFRTSYFFFFPNIFAQLEDSNTINTLICRDEKLSC